MRRHDRVHHRPPGAARRGRPLLEKRRSRESVAIIWLPWWARSRLRRALRAVPYPGGRGSLGQARPRVPTLQSEVPVRLVQFSTPSAGPRPGIVDGETIRPLEGWHALDEFVKLDPAARAAAQRRLGGPGQVDPGATLCTRHFTRTRTSYASGASPWPRARGRRARARRAAESLPVSVPTIFTKAPTAIADPDATLNLSDTVSQKYDWEAELAVVIGTRCKDVPEERALDVVYALLVLERRERARQAARHHPVVRGRNARRHVPARAVAP